MWWVSASCDILIYVSLDLVDDVRHCVDVLMRLMCMVKSYLVTLFTGTGNVRTEKIDNIKLDAECSRLKELSRPTKRDLQALDYFENNEA